MKNNAEEIRKRVLIDPFSRRIPDKVNVLVAPMNLGKTYATFNSYILQLISEGVKKIVVTAPQKIILQQSEESYARTLGIKGIRTFDRDSFNQFIYTKDTSVLLITNSFLIRNIDKLEKLKNNLNDKFAFIADEIHYAGTTAEEFVTPNTGFKSTKSHKYAFANNLSRLSKGSKNVIALTATPLWEQSELPKKQDVYGMPRGSYHILNNEHDAPKGREFLKFCSRLGGIHLSSNWMINDTNKSAPILEDLINNKTVGLSQHWKQIDNVKENLMNQIVGTPFENLVKNLDTRTVTQIVVGSYYKDRALGVPKSSPNSRNINEVTSELINILRSNKKHLKRFKDDKIVLSVHSNGNFLSDLDGGCWKLNDEEVMELLENGDIEFLITVDKLKMGFNLDRITHMSQVRRRKQIEVVTNTVIQSLGRGNRSFFGLKNCNSIEDAIKLIKKLIDYPNIRNALSIYFNHFNTHYAVLPDLPIYQQAKVNYEMNYSSQEPNSYGSCTCDHTCEDPFCTNA
jgi:hypothetical protein